MSATLGNITLPASTYTEVEFKISLSPNGTTPALELNGQYNNAAGTTTADLTH